MKIIEALKQIKYLAKKCSDLESKMAASSADMEFDTPLYDDMKGKIREWSQAHTDIVREIGALRFRIQKTNCLTSVKILLDGNEVTKTVYEWIQRKRDLCAMEIKGINSLSDRGLRDATYQQSNDSKIMPVKVRRYYDPQTKERRLMCLAQEMVLIDSSLEIANCNLDLVE